MEPRKEDASSRTGDVLASTRSTTESLRPPIDPWGIVVVGSPEGIGPLCGEAGRLGFELFRARQLTPADGERLLSTDWAAAVVVEDGTDLDPTMAVLDRHLGHAVPLIWVGEAAGDVGPRPLTQLPPQVPAEHIAAAVFRQAQSQLYPAALVAEIQRQFREVLVALGAPAPQQGPVWVKNTFTPPFSLTAVVELYGDVSGELTVSGSDAWFRSLGASDPGASDAERARQGAAELAGQLLGRLVAYLEGRGADLSAGPIGFVDGGQPVRRRLSHRPALCVELSPEATEHVVVEFSGTGLDLLEPMPARP